MQIIDNNITGSASCEVCGNSMELGQFIFSGITRNYPHQKDEECLCKKCGTKFIFRYYLLDNMGHLQKFIFVEDINDPDFCWQDRLSPEQLKVVTTHLKNCDSCKKLLNETILDDAHFAHFIHNSNSFQKKKR